MGDDENMMGVRKFVTLGEFSKYCEQNDKDHQRITTAMWGSEGTNGMIGDIRELKMWMKFVGIIFGILVPIASALLSTYLSKVLGGG